MFPPNNPALDRIANQASGKVDQLCASWRVPREVGQDIVKLALFDIILYIGRPEHDAMAACSARANFEQITVALCCSRRTASESRISS